MEHIVTPEEFLADQESKRAYPETAQEIIDYYDSNNQLHDEIYEEAVQQIKNSEME